MSFEFLSHLEELRRRLFVWLAAFLIFSVVAYFFSRHIIDFLILPLHGSTELIFQKPYEAFLTHIKAALLTGALFSSPVFFSQAWLFAAPGLYEKEKKFLLALIAASVFLFIAGAFFAYAVVVPWGLGFFLSFQTESLKPMISISAYFSFLNGMILAFGVLFDFPVILLGLSALDVVHSQTLRAARKPVIIILFVISAIMTPSPDPVSQVLLAVPLVLLFEISVAAAAFLEKKRSKTRD